LAQEIGTPGETENPVYLPFLYSLLQCAVRSSTSVAHRKNRGSGGQNTGVLQSESTVAGDKV